MNQSDIPNGIGFKSGVSRENNKRAGLKFGIEPTADDDQFRVELYRDHLLGEFVMKSVKHYSIFLLVLVLAYLSGCATNGDRPERGEDRQQSAGAYLDDSMITTKVKTAIFNEPGLDSAEISVETYQGNVQLSGFVESQNDIERAVRVARQVEGVRSVKNDMRLKSRAR
jgi:hypothetical protein